MRKRNLVWVKGMINNIKEKERERERRMEGRKERKERERKLFIFKLYKKKYL